MPISGAVQTSLLLPASLASVDAAVRAADQHGGSVVCMDVHTAQQAELEAMAGDTGDVTWPDGGAEHAKVQASLLIPVIDERISLKAAVKPAVEPAVKPAVKRSDELIRPAQLIRSRTAIRHVLELEWLSLS